MQAGLFITGTDTDCGKTYVSSLIIRALRKERVDVVGFKPICCGGREDALELHDASEESVDIDVINPYWLKTPAAPHVAAMFENIKIQPAEMNQHYEKITASAKHVVVEGAGGWQVPIEGMDYTIGSMAKEMSLPVILVVGNRLGALNHAILTIESMRAMGVEPAGMVFNNLSDEMETATITNKGIIEELTGVEVITDVIYGQREIEAWPFMEILGI